MISWFIACILNKLLHSKRAITSFKILFFIYKSRAHEVLYVKNRQEVSCSPYAQASHFWASYCMCFIKLTVRKCLHFDRAGMSLTTINAISGNQNCTIQFRAKLLFPSPANLHPVPYGDTLNITEGSKYQADVVSWRNHCNAWQCSFSFRLKWCMGTFS